ncbi:MAG: response regulator [Verrucomicrobiae bacterium]|nr:response regulator [Verrucomicrobiae bacterium]
MNTAPTGRTPVRILHLEDDENDYLLVKEMLAADGLACELTLARTRSEFEQALRANQYDLIISDYTLPSYDGMKALALMRQYQSRVPFIFFSGTIGEEIAVESLKTGATDYVVKQRPRRLVAAVHRALQEAEERARLEAARTALRESEERFRIVARATNDVIWEWHLQKQELWHSENFASVFGQRPVAGMSLTELWSAFLHPDDRERILNSVTALLAARGQVWWGEYRFRRADGTFAHVLDRAFISYDAGGQPVRMVGVAIDMTERKQAEEKIREQAALLDKAHDAIIVCDLDERITYWNHSAERVYGWSASEAKGRRMGDLLFQQLPLALTEARHSLLETGEWLGELHQAARDGTPITVQSSWTLVRDAGGRPSAELIINTDVSEHKRLEAKFLRTQRLESLGILVGGIAHDLNNALAPVIMGAGLLRLHPLPPEAAEVLDTMSNSARRGADMVQQILTFARGGDASKTMIRVDQLAKEMARLINDTFPKSITCRVRASEDSWPVSGLATQLHQVLMNLCINARDAMAKGGLLTLATRNVVVSEAQAARHPGVSPGRFLCLSVTDTGTGIPPQQMAEIFQPFFTTKAPGHGTGLGLSTSLTIVRNHGGFMEVESQPGVGAEFRVYLPAVETAAPAEAPAAAALPAGNGEGILIVDDEASICALAKTTLEHYGYRVFTAASGPEAVALMASAFQEIQLVVTDKSMPLMDGAATAQALRKLQPELKLILFSGHQRVKKSETDVQIKADAFIEKPFTVEKLLTVVHEVLAK